ncbi:MAG: hypothetical protein SVR81_07090, partial [Chloroflexota bacterium]|nr:hypothetical protein [Chloroflexota bacterium]
MKKLHFLIALIMVTSLVLSACATTPTEAPMTEEPVAEETAEEPAEEEPETEMVALNPYIGSNQLDGNGVPGTFFDDVHIRKAFAYAFDA